MDDILNWQKITSGFYRYVLSPNTYYEILITDRVVGSDIHSSKASLFLVSNRLQSTRRGRLRFRRVRIADEQPLTSCLAQAALTLAN